VGGGPIGIACGLEAKKKDLDYLIIEKGTIVNSLFNYPSNMQFFSSSEKLEIDQIPFISKEAKPKRNEALEYYRRIVTSNDLNIQRIEKVQNIEKNDEDQSIVKTDKKTYSATIIIISTGFYDIPNIKGINGSDLHRLTHYSNLPHF